MHVISENSTYIIGVLYILELGKGIFLMSSEVNEEIIGNYTVLPYGAHMFHLCF